MKSILLLVAAIAPLAAQSRFAVIHSTGTFDFNGTAIYGVYLASRTEALEEITISAALPKGTRFLENVDTPRGGVYEGVQDNIILWRFPRLPADSVVGPFNFRVKLEDPGVELPETLHTAASWQRPVPELLESRTPTGKLKQFAESGTLSIDNRGTVNAQNQNVPVVVGDTGIKVFIPANAFSSPAKLDFQRIPTTAVAKPDGLWWCYLVRISITTSGTSQGSFLIVAPPARPLPIGAPGQLNLFEDGEATSASLNSKGPRTISDGTSNFCSPSISCGVSLNSSSRTTGSSRILTGPGLDAELRSIAQSTGEKLSGPLQRNVTAAEFLLNPITIDDVAAGVVR